jgi:hypothetical protein
MAAVLTTTMTLRIILSVRGSLAQGGAYAGSAVSSSNRANTTTHVLSSAGRANPVPPHPSSFGPTASSFGAQSNGRNVLEYGGPERKGSLNGGGQGKEGTYTLDEMRDKAARGEWNEGASDGRSSIIEVKEGVLDDNARVFDGVKVTIDREVDYHGRM